jgi:protein involved in polysaccharide export with SLBB domain
MRLPSAARRRALRVISLRGTLYAALLTFAGTVPAWAQMSIGTPNTADSNASAAPGPLRLRQPLMDEAGNNTPSKRNVKEGNSKPLTEQPQDERRGEPPSYKPGEFDLFVQGRIGRALLNEGGEVASVRRLGAELLTHPADSESIDFSPQVPPDYLIKNGDEIVVTLWGSVDADVRLVVDRTGRVSIPRVGPVLVAGVRYAELPDVIRRRVAQVFRNFELSVSLGQLRGVRVYVTGFVERPGTYSVSSLSSVLSALLRAGGPSAAGSMRNITLQRGGKALARYDLYDFLLKGDRSTDMLVQPDDVIHIGPVGQQVAVIGSVNHPVILEIKPGETVDDALRMSGGYTAVADRSRLAVERLEQRTGERIAELPMPLSGRLPLSNGDILRAFSAVETQLSVQKQNKRVLVEGEVARPGEYVLSPNSSLNDALRAAGGLSPSAYVFGTQFIRTSVQRTQQENYERALRDLETDLAKANVSYRATTADDVATQAARANSSSQLVSRLRAIKPSGRIVLQMAPESTTLPDLPLEDGDRLYVPPRNSTVGVFGSVFNAGSYLWSMSRSIDDYLRQAGGPTRGADRGSVFVIRANGSVISSLQDGGSWFSRSNGLGNVPAQAGDTIFVPEEMNKTTFTQNLRDWTQILYQLGLGAAAIQVLRKN